MESFGGLYTAVGPASLPEGAASRAYDVDFLIGDVLTRNHLQSYYSYGSIFAGPNPGSTAVNTPLPPGSAWVNPSAILVGDSVPTIIGAAVGALIGGGSDALDVTGFAFNLPAADAVTGLTVTILGYASAPSTINVQLLFNGVPSGTIHTATISTGTTSLTFGSAVDSWANALGPAAVNATTFGIRITVSSIWPLASVFLDYATLNIYQTSSAANFNFITTFPGADGTIRNISLDALGNFWIENATTAPGVLTLLSEGVTPGSYAVGQTTENAEFLAISNLLTGSDVPRQYNAQGWFDRVSQVGPGASPIFAATTTTGTTPASITSWAASGGVVTFQATNTFTAGEVVTLSAFGTTTAFNGQVFNVLGSGLTTSQFEINFAGVTGSRTEAGLASPQYTYPIVASPNGITQNPQTTITFGGVLWSAAPGSTTPGTTVTFYYQDSTVNAIPFFGMADPVLTTLFNSGVAVYVYISNSPVGNGTWQVTSVGIGTQPQESRQYYYFTIQVPQTEYANYKGQQGAAFNYQITAATLTTLVPVPDLATGQQFSISGASPSNWNNLWTVSQSLNSSTMSITQTSMAAGIATYSYALTGGSTAPPAVGELVTVTNTLNGGGIFNVIDVPITGVTGTNSGTFTVGSFPTSDNFPSQLEAGQGQTAGTQFQFDPGQADAGTQSNPIFGNGGGGVISLASSSGQVISPGTKQGVVYFITRNGYETAPSPPVQFTVPINSNYILATLIPIGPPNVIARGIAFTESGANGVPGGNFFTIPTQVQFIVNGVTYTSSTMIINDNVTTSAKFTFSDSVLLNSTAIDVEGNNLFNLIEIGSPGWLMKYASRMVYGQCQNKIQNFLNLSFDGGYFPGTNPTPLGWNVDATNGFGGSVINSAVFGNSYYIVNSSASTEASIGMVTQPAYQDAYQVPIINIQTLYSIRVAARAPSSNPNGSLVVELINSNVGTGYGTIYGTYTIPLGSMTASMQIFTGTFLTTKFATVPPGLLLRVHAINMAAGADVEIDRIEIFPTQIPVLNTQCFVSYANNYESVDAVTGVLGVSGQNQQPVNFAQNMDGNLYLLKEGSWYETQDTANTEPAYWDVAKDVSQRAGACGPLASDQGEGWIVTACRNGGYIYTGGQPQKFTHDIIQIWDSINWAAGQTIWVKNDTDTRRLYIGVPLPTPNFWLPNAPVNAAPTTPNVILMMNYWGVDSGDALKEAGQVHATMFGNLMAPDMRRKWAIWQISSPFAEIVKDGSLDARLMICNGVASSKIYTLQPNAVGVIPTDDGAPINSLYTTYSWNSSQKVRGNPAMGNGRIRWGYGTMNVSGAGVLNLVLYPDELLTVNSTAPGFYSWTVPGGFPLTDPGVYDREFVLNVAGYRMFMEFSTSGYFDLNAITMTGRKDTWNTVRGIK